jgi:uncharacterized protein
MINGSLGRPSRSECFGYGPMTVITVDPNGHIGPTDTLRISANNPYGKFNITDHELDEIKNDTAMKWVIEQSLTLSDQCKKCPLVIACGGGYLPHRWSSKTHNYLNPSIYCEDIIRIFSYIGKKIEQSLNVKRVS